MLQLGCKIWVGACPRVPVMGVSTWTVSSWATTQQPWLDLLEALELLARDVVAAAS